MSARVAAHRFVLELIDKLRRRLGRPFGEDLTERDLPLSQLRHDVGNAAGRFRIATTAHATNASARPAIESIR